MTRSCQLTGSTSDGYEITFTKKNRGKLAGLVPRSVRGRGIPRQAPQVAPSEKHQQKCPCLINTVDFGLAIRISCETVF